MLGVHEIAPQGALWGVCWSSLESPTLDVSHMTFHTAALDYWPLHQKNHHCCACSTAPAEAPDDALALLPPARHHSPAVPSIHHPSTPSRIRTQDFFSDPAKLHILDGFSSKPGIYSDILENRPSFIQTVLQTSTNRVWVLTFLWNLKPHVFHMV